MHDVMKIDVKENIHSENDHIAEHVKAHLSEDGVLVVNVMGAPGVGKTTTLKNIFKNLNTAKPYVIEGDIESDIDTIDLQIWVFPLIRSIPLAPVISMHR